jgi:DNA repair exonuclease SbcCD ATPase subunit
LGQGEVNSLTAELAAAARRIDEIRSSLASDSAIAEATARLRAFASTTATSESLSGVVRLRMATVEVELESLSTLRDLLPRLNSTRTSLRELRDELLLVRHARDQAANALAASIPPLDVEKTSGELARRARELVSLIMTGRTVGLIEQHCPLCSAQHSEESFQSGTLEAEAAAARIDEIAAAVGQREEQYRIAASALAEQEERLKAVASQIASHERLIHDIEEQCSALGVASDASVDDLNRRAADLRGSLEGAQRDLRVLDTLRLNLELTKSLETQQVAKERLVL